jgi:hypothetical protein
MSNRFPAAVNSFEREKGWHNVSVPVDLCQPLEHIEVSFNLRER